MTELVYRKELDGVRSIAILSVLLFHLGFPSMAGGFVGVDVFFVLSGYLICGQTYIQLEIGKYSVLDFFARRIRRLSSAYFVCFFVTALVGLLLFLQSEHEMLFRNLVGSATFTNNFNLLQNQGYFNVSAHENPFLHTWSLAVEKQFYIALPLLILLVQRSLVAFRQLLVFCFVVSLGLTLFSGNQIYDQDQRFFSSILRVWELATGALVFVIMKRYPSLPQMGFLAPLGLVLIIAPVGYLGDGYLYPGWATLVPVLGTAMLIYAGCPTKSFAGKMIALRPMVYIGRISYGSYLWHWPLIVFIQYIGVNLNDVLRSALLLASLVLGALSFHLVEQPLRRWDIARNRAKLFWLFLGQTIVLLATALFIFVTSNQVNEGENAEIALLKAASDVFHDDFDKCWLKSRSEDFCRVGQYRSEGADFLVWGDSMVNSAYWAFDDYARETQKSGIIATAPACAPLLGVVRDNSSAEVCRLFNREILTFLEQAPPMDLILFARWSYYAEGYGNIGFENGKVALLDNAGFSAGDQSFAAFSRAFEETLLKLPKKHKVIIVGQVPVYSYHVPKAMLKEKRFGTAPEVKTLLDFKTISGRTSNVVRQLSTAQDLKLIEPETYFCPRDVCYYEIDGDPLYSDHVHLSMRGNAVFKDFLLETLGD